MTDEEREDLENTEDGDETEVESEDLFSEEGLVAVEEEEIITNIKELLLDPDDHTTFVLEYYPDMKVTFEQLATVEYKGTLYAYMHPISKITKKNGKVIDNPADATFYLDEAVYPATLCPVSSLIASNKVLTEYNRMILGKKTKNMAILKKNIYVK
ncbi:MAG: hypothetical protein LUD47_04345 [Clostridia bacterium]|nr:hypothetical protein [Clostridia bacterium]